MYLICMCQCASGCWYFSGHLGEARQRSHRACMRRECNRGTHVLTYTQIEHTHPIPPLCMRWHDTIFMKCENIYVFCMFTLRHSLLLALPSPINIFTAIYPNGCVFGFNLFRRICTLLHLHIPQYIYIYIMRRAIVPFSLPHSLHHNWYAVGKYVEYLNFVSV